MVTSSARPVVAVRTDGRVARPHSPARVTRPVRELPDAGLLAGPAGLTARRLQVRLLGPFEVVAAGRPLVVTSPRLRSLLAVLAISALRPVSVDRLATAVWPEQLPHNAAATIQTYVSRLRSILGSAAITTTGSGYTLNADPDDVDAIRFLHLLEAATAADPVSERRYLGEALALWRGAPFEGVRSAWLEDSEAPQLQERYLAALERRIDLDAAGGRYGELAAELRELTARYPLRESLWVRLVLLLNRAGRPAEALEAYEAVRARIADELGVDPGRDLQQAYTELLTGTIDVAAGGIVPRQLPCDIQGSVARANDLSTLDQLGQTAARSVRPAAIVAVTGPEGTGKTTLAVHWAHTAADRFPDGQLYLDLRGFGAAGPAWAPSDALRVFLEALHVRPEQIPSGLDARVSLYRSLLAEKRMLVVLDNARDTEQVRSLLPGGPGCVTVITSRDQLTGLVAATGARALVLGPLAEDDARLLLTERLGSERVERECEAVAEIVAMSGGLPGTLALVAARAATDPNLRLAALAAQLRRERVPEPLGTRQAETLRLPPRYRTATPSAHSCTSCEVPTLIPA